MIIQVQIKIVTLMFLKKIIVINSNKQVIKKWIIKL